jgi:hypothetical protein
MTAELFQFSGRRVTTKQTDPSLMDHVSRLQAQAILHMSRFG